MFEGDTLGSVTRWGQVTDLEMIYGCSCDTALTSLGFTISLIFPLSLFLLSFSFLFPPVSVITCKAAGAF